MKTYALIDKGIVTNLVVADDPSIFHNDKAIELQVRPEVGWTYDGSVFAPPEPQKIVDAKLVPSDVADLVAALSRSGLSPARIQEIEAKINPAMPFMAEMQAEVV